jgi:hypothetical protein
MAGPLNVGCGFDSQHLARFTRVATKAPRLANDPRMTHAQKQLWTPA